MFCLSGVSAIEFWRHYDSRIPGTCVFGHTLGAGPTYAEAFPSSHFRSLRRTSALDVDRDILASLDRERFGLSDVGPIHLLVERDCRRKLKGDLVVHTVSCELPAGSILIVENGMCVASPELAILQVSSSFSELDLLLLIYEFCGCYSLGGFSADLLMRHPLTSVEALSRMLSQGRNLKCSSKLQKVLAFAMNGSGSPRETAVALLMHLPKRYGGFGLPRSELNLSVDLGKEGAALWGKRNAFDMVWREARIVVEYDGREAHSSEAQRDRDNARRNAAAAQGYAVYVFTEERLRSVDHVCVIAAAIAKRLGFRLVFQRGDFWERHMKLRTALRLSK